MAESLRDKAINGVLWSGAERFIGSGLNFLFGLVLARLLLPSQYGVIAMLAIFMAISQSIIDSGFANALIRKPDRSEADNATALYFNIVVGVVMYGVLYLCAPLIANFYDTPELILITRVFGVTLLLNSLCIVQQAILTARIDFKTQTKISVYAAIFSGVVGIGFAYYGYGVWALVAQAVASAALRAILLWTITRWRPTERFSGDSFKALFGYGSKLLAAGIMETVYRNLYTIIIGKLFDAGNLGLYSRGEQIAYFSANNVSGVIQRVSFPVLSAIQSEEERLRVNFLKILRVACFFVFPLMVLLMAAASPLVDIILTGKWIGCVPIIQILCLSFMWFPVHILNLNVLQVLGRSDLFFRIEVIKKIIGIAILIATIPLGLLAMCWGRVLYCIIELFINMFYTNRLLQITAWEQMRRILPLFIHAAFMGAAAYYVSTLFGNDFLKLAVAVGICFAYWMILSMFLKDVGLKDIRATLKRATK